MIVCFLNWGSNSEVFIPKEKWGSWGGVYAQSPNHSISQLWDPVTRQKEGAKVEEVQKDLVLVSA